MTSPHRQFHRLAWLAVLLALGVIVFGAFVRLSNAGLSCPDWPTCYGRATWPQHDEAVDHAATAIRAVESHKAWREQFHRHIAATLGLMVLGLAVLAARARRHGLATVLGASALVAISIPLYMRQHYTEAAVLAGVAEALLLMAAWRWSNTDFARVATLTLAVIIFQAMLGMWTVTWLLKPVVVMSHLVGGLTTFSLLVWMACRASPNAALPVHASLHPKLRRMLIAGIALVAIQIALGGWVSANYAALACGTDFPTCLGQWWPATDFGEGFVLWRGIGVDYEGGVLDGPARAAIHLAHRLFALLVAGHLIALGLRLRRATALGAWGVALLVLLGLQILLGISNVVTGLPLKIATAHNLGAAVLLFVLVSLLARLRPASAGASR
ncbi:MAG: COX15/CtaA family protein [Chiayiivirga sp.]|jgi:cytochrome c oxidase assembly protein subunit 15|uniref:COX15/CtaA family protein n=1 Tax=Chiayiivirga sp. TaxID=2041042 RepID=UPI0025C28825|nr:COX15/CtaA family protein [Chiayiivirga sp.]MCI1711793.1 COX15/CtaA family protein [Chiayiivirga sp.]MCI1729627.1 COX15/CtaA family protein [Chiayiivirga sp.]